MWLLYIPNEQLLVKLGKTKQNGLGFKEILQSDATQERREISSVQGFMFHRAA